MEFCEKSTLRSAIDQGLYQDQRRVWRYLREIAEGLAHIHSQVVYNSYPFLFRERLEGGAYSCRRIIPVGTCPRSSGLPERSAGPQHCANSAKLSFRMVQRNGEMYCAI